MIITILASISAIATGIMSTLCCVGPATLKVVGLEGFELGPWFAENRIYNITATILLLGVAYYFEYGKNKTELPSSESVNGEKTQVTPKRNWSKIVLWTSYGLIIVFKLTPEVITFVYNF